MLDKYMLIDMSSCENKGIFLSRENLFYEFFRPGWTEIDMTKLQKPVRGLRIRIRTLGLHYDTDLTGLSV